jgi:hypothetical protein
MFFPQGSSYVYETFLYQKATMGWFETGLGECA